MKTRLLKGKEWEILNYQTKKAQSLISQYDSSDCYCIKDAYPSGGSWAKNRIWDDWYDWLQKNNFRGMKVVSHSHFLFSIGALIEVGDRIYQIHVTASHWYIIERKDK